MAARAQKVLVEQPQISHRRPGSGVAMLALAFGSGRTLQTDVSGAAFQKELLCPL